MENRVYYGQYSLKHWIELILKKNIVLPEYQRLFVWDESKVSKLLKTFKNKEFVPPVIIGLYKEADDSTQNLILDGQQRLTSLLLAYLGLFPDKKAHQAKIERLASENDEELEVEEMDDILEWNFKQLTDKGATKEKIIKACIAQTSSYKQVKYDINEDDLKTTYLGFSYIVPNNNQTDIQQGFYSSVFRNINIQGQVLLPQESRQALYFLDKSKEKFFDPDIAKEIKIHNAKTETKIDFVRYLALLAQYHSSKNAAIVAKHYYNKLEKYYEDFIYSVIGNHPLEQFSKFEEIIPEQDYKSRFDTLRESINELSIPKEYNSIIDMDVYLFGLIYYTIFEGKKLEYTKHEELSNDIKNKIRVFKDPDYHTSDSERKEAEIHRRNPGTLGRMRNRLDSSINIYTHYIK